VDAKQERTMPPPDKVAEKRGSYQAYMAMSPPAKRTFLRQCRLAASTATPDDRATMHAVALTAVLQYYIDRAASDDMDAEDQERLGDFLISCGATLGASLSEQPSRARVLMPCRARVMMLPAALGLLAELFKTLSSGTECARIGKEMLSVGLNPNCDHLIGAHGTQCPFETDENLHRIDADLRGLAGPAFGDSSVSAIEIDPATETKRPWFDEKYETDAATEWFERTREAMKTASVGAYAALTPDEKLGRIRDFKASVGATTRAQRAALHSTAVSVLIQYYVNRAGATEMDTSDRIMLGRFLEKIKMTPGEPVKPERLAKIACAPDARQFLDELSGRLHSGDELTRVGQLTLALFLNPNCNHLLGSHDSYCRYEDDQELDHCDDDLAGIDDSDADEDGDEDDDGEGDDDESDNDDAKAAVAE